MKKYSVLLLRDSDPEQPYLQHVTVQDRDSQGDIVAEAQILAVGADVQDELAPSRDYRMLLILRGHVDVLCWGL